MDRPLVLVIEDAKSVLMSTVITIKNQTGLPSTILDDPIFSCEPYITSVCVFSVGQSRQR